MIENPPHRKRTTQPQPASTLMQKATKLATDIVKKKVWRHSGSQKDSQKTISKSSQEINKNVIGKKLKRVQKGEQLGLDLKWRTRNECCKEKVEIIGACIYLVEKLGGTALIGRMKSKIEGTLEGE